MTAHRACAPHSSTRTRRLRRHWISTPRASTSAIRKSTLALSSSDIKLGETLSAHTQAIDARNAEIQSTLLKVVPASMTRSADFIESVDDRTNRIESALTSSDARISDVLASHASAIEDRTAGIEQALTQQR